jgi:hypothetical protein
MYARTERATPLRKLNEVLARSCRQARRSVDAELREALRGLSQEAVFATSDIALDMKVRPVANTASHGKIPL